MTSLNKVLHELILLPREKVIDAVPASTDGWVTSYHTEVEKELLWGFLPNYVSHSIPEREHGKFSGYFIFTQWRMLFVADDKKYSKFPEIMYETPLHNVEEISVRGFFDKSLHVDAHTTQGVTHFTFYGNKVAEQAHFFREAVRTHDAADFWRGQARNKYQNCARCKKQISLGLKYCPYCGNVQQKVGKRNITILKNSKHYFS